jgi:hypothetical protein
MTQDNKLLHLLRPDCPLPRGAHVLHYCRDSGGDSQDRSVSQQVLAGEEYARAHGLIIEQVLTDDARTASNTEKRDGLNDLLHIVGTRFKEIHDRYKREKIAQERPFGVLCWMTDRIGRDQLETSNIRNFLRLRGITLIGLMNNPSTGDLGIDMLLESFYDWKSERLLDDISMNARRGLADLVGLRDDDAEFLAHNPGWQSTGAYLGIMPGKVPLGFRGERIVIGTYKRKRSGEIREVQRIVPDVGNTWERARLAWEMRVGGASIKAIHDATRLARKTSGYTYFFSNPIYTGTLEFGGQRYENFVPALISQEWFDLEQARKAERSRRMQGASYTTFDPRSAGAGRLLSGILFCGAEEGKPHAMHFGSIPAKQGKGAWDFYICSYKKATRGEGCQSRRIGARQIEDAVIEQLFERILTLDVLRPIAEQYSAQMNDRNRDMRLRIMAVDDDLAATRSAIGKLLDAVEISGLSPHLQKRLEERETAERDLLERKHRLELLLVPDEDRELISEAEVQAWIDDVQAALMEGGTRAQQVIRSFVESVTVVTDVVTIQYTLPFLQRTRLVSQRMDLWGFEPQTSSMPLKRSPN